MAGQQAETRPEDRAAVYSQICVSYHGIDDIRGKLLGLLPVVSGAGIGLLLTSKTPAPEEFRTPVGVFGALATLGLLCYELHGIKKCGYLIAAGQHIEAEMGILGQFRSRPREVMGFVDEPFAAAVIYPATLASWTYLALADDPHPLGAQVTAPCVFVGFAGLMLWCIRAMERDLEQGHRYVHEPVWFRSARWRRANRRGPHRVARVCLLCGRPLGGSPGATPADAGQLARWANLFGRIRRTGRRRTGLPLP